MKFLKEISDFCRFFWKTPKDEKKIVFYAEHEGYWPNFEGIIEELTEKNSQTICYITSDPTDPVLQHSNPKIKTFYIKKLLTYFMLFVKCKAFVMTMPDLNQFYIKRSVNPVHYVYVFHSMVSTNMAYLQGAFDYYDSMLCVGQYQIDEIRKFEKLHNLPEKQLVLSGFHRLEKVYNSYQKYLEGKSSDSQKTTILIAPSWGPDNVIESCGERLTKLLLEKGYEVIVRAHPETVRRSPKLLDAIDKQFRDNPGFKLERSVANYDSILKADVLICDLSGIVLEYAFGTERPVLFLDVPYKIRNKNYKELGIEPLELVARSKIGITISPEKLESVPETIEKLKSEKGEYKERIVKLREENIYAFGNASEIGAKHIIELVGS